MSIKNWFITLINGNNTKKSLQIGSKVRLLKGGTGEVIGGAIHVRLDKPFRAKNNSMNSGITTNIKNIKVL